MANFTPGQGNQEENELSEINIIPLVDVMLVLLIIFMVAAPLSITGIKIDLPKSKAKAAVIPEDKIVLSVDENGKYFMEKSEIASRNLVEKFSAIFEFKKQKNLFIRADGKVPYEKVIFAMSAAKQAGVNKIGMLTKPDNKKQ